jgi:thioredoxin reductase (NADPH)
MPDYDIVVVGGGLAALTAGLFSARAGRSTLVLEPAVPGGHLVNIQKIEDFPGFPDGVSGYELGPNTQLQAMNHGAEFAMAEVQALTRVACPDEGGGDLSGDWLVTTTDGEHRAGAVIVASGSHARALGVPGEERLLGRGVSHCASCDGPLFRGQTVGVVGGGDSALQEALTLAEHAGRVLIFHRGETFVAQKTYRQRVEDERKIEVCHHTEVLEILGDSEVTGVRVHDLAAAERTVDLGGLFVYVGLIPNSGFLVGLLPLDDEGRILTDLWMRTELPGLFAAGDIRRDSASQAITAAGDGATAAIAADRYLRVHGEA